MAASNGTGRRLLDPHQPQPGREIVRQPSIQAFNPANRPTTLQHDLRPEATMVTAAQQIGVTPAGAYAWRPPSPPHIHVPQTADDQLLDLPASSDTGYGYSDEDKQILQTITQAPNAKLGVRDWKYEHRRGAQSILSFVYLGPSAGARDIEYLRREGITMLLVIRDRMSAMARLLSGDKAAAALGIESAAVDVTGNQELIATFPKVTRIINEHLIRVYKQRRAQGFKPEGHPGKVLLFCESGNERSAIVMAAYLMEIYGLDMISAIQYVQSQRFCVAFDDGLKNLLYSYQDILDAQKFVRHNSPVPQGIAPRLENGSKRRRNDSRDDDDMDMDQADDEERFGNRSNFVPFRDEN